VLRQKAIAFNVEDALYGESIGNEGQEQVQSIA
jgi:hypothetical protein